MRRARVEARLVARRAADRVQVNRARVRHQRAPDSRVRPAAREHARARQPEPLREPRHPATAAPRAPLEQACQVHHAPAAHREQRAAVLPARPEPQGLPAAAALEQDLTQVAERAQVQRAVRAHLAPQRADLDQRRNRAPVGGALFFACGAESDSARAIDQGLHVGPAECVSFPYLRRWRRPLGLGRC